LLVLELGRIKGRRVVHKGGRIEHGSTCVRVEEASAIMILDGGVVHPGAHVCGKEVRQPICKCDKKSAGQYQKEVSIEGLDGPTEMAKCEARPGAMDVATRWMDQ
jgi:hypothetical protein